MPPPSRLRGDTDPPDQITSEAVTGFIAGAFKYGSVSILAHMILTLPHPFTFSKPAAPSTPIQANAPGQPKPRPNRPTLGARLFYKPLEGFSAWLSPTARIYQGLTPQFKVFLQIAAMTLGGCVWAERRVTTYFDLLRAKKREERRIAERSWE